MLVFVHSPYHRSQILNFFIVALQTTICVSHHVLNPNICTFTSI
jgi:hypothetical protein